MYIELILKVRERREEKKTKVIYLLFSLLRPVFVFSLIPKVDLVKEE